MSQERFIDVPDIKPQCFNRCPQICESLVRLAELTDERDVVIKSSTAYMAGQYSIHEQIKEQVSPEVADVVNEGLRQTLVDGMDQVDEAIAGVRGEMQQHCGSCIGPLTMRASKADTMYTVTVCTSPYAYPDTPTHTSAHIQMEQRPAGTD